jgi:hypothetical protein
VYTQVATKNIRNIISPLDDLWYTCEKQKNNRPKGDLKSMSFSHKKVNS